MKEWVYPYSLLLPLLVAISCQIEVAYILIPSHFISECKETLAYILKVICRRILTATLCIRVKIWKLMSINRVDIGCLQKS